VYAAQSLGADSTIRAAQAVTAIHPQNPRALALVADAYREKGMVNEYVATLMTLQAVDPTNLRIRRTVIEALVAAARTSDAKKLIDEAVQQMPGDPTLNELRWRVYLADKDYAGAARIGEEILATDTATASEAFFDRLTGVYLIIGDTSRAEATAARGVGRFPRNANLRVAHAQTLRMLGRSPQWAAQLDSATRLDPNIDRIWLQLARALLETNAPTDSVIYALRRAAAAGDSASAVGAYGVSVGNTLYRRAVASRKIDDFKIAIGVLSWADSLSSNDTAKFLVGVSHLNVAQLLLQPAEGSVTCAAAQEAATAVNEALILVPRGARAFPEPAAQAMRSLGVLSPAADQAKRTHCR
jgi:predicted Zn-dependent protease